MKSVSETIGDYIKDISIEIIRLEKLKQEWERLLFFHKEGIKPIENITQGVSYMMDKERPNKLIANIDTSLKLTPEVVEKINNEFRGKNFKEPITNMNDSQIAAVAGLGNTKSEDIGKEPKFIKSPTKWEQLLVYFNTQIIDNPIMVSKVNLELPEISNTVRDAYLSTLVTKGYVERVGKGFIKLLKPIPLDESSTVQRITP